MHTNEDQRLLDSMTAEQKNKITKELVPNYKGFDGELGPVVFYSESLTEEEIKDLFKNNNTMKEELCKNCYGK